jgi:hypothetical protein
MAHESGNCNGQIIPKTEMPVAAGVGLIEFGLTFKLNWGTQRASSG